MITSIQNAVRQFCIVRWSSRCLDRWWKQNVGALLRCRKGECHAEKLVVAWEDHKTHHLQKLQTTRSVVHPTNCMQQFQLTDASSESSGRCSERANSATQRFSRGECVKCYAFLLFTLFGGNFEPCKRCIGGFGEFNRWMTTSSVSICNCVGRELR